MAGGIPELGFGVGTAFFKSSGQPDREALLTRSVHAALDAGFRHIDEAEMYENEATTGEALRAWLARNPGTPRSSLFVTSKVMTVEAGIENVCRRSLAAMKLEYFDLYLVHAPWKKSGAPFEMPLAQVWKQMEALVDAGLVHLIGVSNWRIADLQQIVDDARILPACNQIEAHPYLQQPALMRYCREHSIVYRLRWWHTRLSRLSPGPSFVGGRSMQPWKQPRWRMGALLPRSCCDGRCRLGGCQSPPPPDLTAYPSTWAVSTSSSATRRSPPYLMPVH